MTLRGLQWAVEARQRREWERTASILAMLFNANRDAKVRAKSPDEFNPYSLKAQSKPIKMTMREYMRTQGVAIPEPVKPEPVKAETP